MKKFRPPRPRLIPAIFVIVWSVLFITAVIAYAGFMICFLVKLGIP